MKVFVFRIFVALATFVTVKGGIVRLYGSLDTLQIDSGTCPEYDGVFEQYRNSLYNFTIEAYKRAAARVTNQFVISPHSLWMTLAGIAEGADHASQHQLFHLLHLPSDMCLRQHYYRIAATRYPNTTDAVVSTRALVIDQGVTPKPNWHNFVAEFSLLDIESAPIRYNPAAAANKIRQTVDKSFPKLNLSGNSVLIDTFDYNGLWTTAFSDAVVERAPFYNIAGQLIGAVDLMRLKRRGRIAYMPNLKSKILELPVGRNAQYRIVIALVVENVDLTPIVADLKSSIICDVLASLIDSNVTIDVALPRFSLKSEFNAKTVVKDLGVTRIWSDAAATRYISEPPAQPSCYVQRTTMTLQNGGSNPAQPSELDSNGNLTIPGDTFWTEFIANKPFIFGLFDAETYTCLMATMYTQPTYPK